MLYELAGFGASMKTIAKFLPSYQYSWYVISWLVYIRPIRTGVQDLPVFGDSLSYRKLMIELTQMR